MGTPSNTDRAKWARGALAAFQTSHQCDGDTVTDAQDLICDLLHLVDEIEGEGQAETILELAWTNYDAEVEDERTE